MKILDRILRHVLSSYSVLKITLMSYFEDFLFHWKDFAALVAYANAHFAPKEFKYFKNKRLTNAYHHSILELDKVNNC